MATPLPGTGVPVSTDPITTLNGGAATPNEIIQRVKLSTGVPGTATDASAANPIPIAGPVTGLAGAALALDGADITTPTAMPAGGVGIRGWLSAIWTKLNGTVGVTGTFWQATQPVSAASLPLPTGAATDLGLANIFARLADGSVVALVSGSVSVSNFPASQAVTGAFWQATQPVSFTWAGLTDTQLRATPVPVSGTVAVTGSLTDTQLRASAVPVSLAATVAVSGPLTDTQLRATAVPVSGTVAVTGALTDTQLRATAVPVSNASLPLPTGAATETSLAGVRTDLGTDGSSPPAVLGLGTGVRGWLRSIYEKLTGSIAVTGTFWQATQPVSGTVTTARPSTATRTNVTAAAADTLLIAANASRFGLTVWNDADKTLYLALGTTTASLTSATVPIAAGDYYEVPFSASVQVRGIWAAGPTGSARITELT